MSAKTNVERKTIMTVVGVHGNATIRITLLDDRLVIRGSLPFKEGNLSDLRKAFTDAVDELEK